MCDDTKLMLDCPLENAPDPFGNAILIRHWHGEEVAWHSEGGSIVSGKSPHRVMEYCTACLAEDIRFRCAVTLLDIRDHTCTGYGNTHGLNVLCRVYYTHIYLISKLFITFLPQLDYLTMT